MKREAGILMPISALDSPYGIGSFSKEAYAFADFLASASQSVWQILPLCPTGYGDSPYQSPCSFAGNPYFIDPDTLAEMGLISKEDCRSYSADSNSGRVDYGLLYERRYSLLRIAYESFIRGDESEDYRRFLVKNSFWLEDYALFSAIKNHLAGAPLSSWEDSLCRRLPNALAQYREKLSYEIGFVKFMQYQFFSQWQRLRDYANQKGISIMGDLPIYVSADSSDLWVDPKLFLLDDKLRPLFVAGCPPDGFSPSGQLWGNPIYDWQAHEAEDFAWWRRRLLAALHMYDRVRIDHFRGFEAFYSIPYGAPDATGGHWERGPGEALFSRIMRDIPPEAIIAEDLGYITEEVRELARRFGFAGMKILQFAFDGDTERYISEYLPHNYERNTVAYTGTHDNMTLAEWLSSLDGAAEEKLRDYILDRHTPKAELTQKLISVAMEGVSRLCIIPMQDYLGLGAEGRMNLPASDNGNWSWRMPAGALTDGLCENIRRHAVRSGRAYPPDIR